MTDLIRRADADAAIVGCKGNGATRQYCCDAIAALPAVMVGVINEEQNTEQSRVFWNWLPLAYRDGHVGDDAKFTKYNMEVAHYAGWRAALDGAEDRIRKICLDALISYGQVEAERDAANALLLHTAASLAAAISLLERGGKKAAASDKMFAQMLTDYRNTLDKARAHLGAKP